mmetsp:Transcript_83351/g.214652  ORF Transcript_83351/g.214652 Transcript_83351/m.214652 type:complete len:233 (+) Transcript_83351:273-971(+)
MPSWRPSRTPLFAARPRVWSRNPQLLCEQLLRPSHRPRSGAVRCAETAADQRPGAPGLRVAAGCGAASSWSPAPPRQTACVGRCTRCRPAGIHACPPRRAPREKTSRRTGWASGPSSSCFANARRRCPWSPGSLRKSAGTPWEQTERHGGAPCQDGRAAARAHAAARDRPHLRSGRGWAAAAPQLVGPCCRGTSSLPSSSPPRSFAARPSGSRPGRGRPAPPAGSRAARGTR